MEINARKEAKWVQILANLLRYIDDGLGMSKVKNSFGFEVNRVFHRIKHAVQAQNVFRHIVRAAEDNAKKTSMQSGISPTKAVDGAYAKFTDNGVFSVVVARVSRGMQVERLARVNGASRPD